MDGVRGDVHQSIQTFSKPEGLKSSDLLHDMGTIINNNVLYILKLLREWTLDVLPTRK